MADESHQVQAAEQAPELPPEQADTEQPQKMSAEQAAEFRALAAEAAGADPAQPGQPSPGEPPTHELLAPIVSFACDALAPAWNIQQQEKQALAEAYAAVLDKYWPDGIGQFGVELNALLITAAVLGPRLRVPRYPEPAKAEERAEPAKGEGDE